MAMLNLTVSLDPVLKLVLSHLREAIVENRSPWIDEAMEAVLAISPSEDETVIFLPWGGASVARAQWETIPFTPKYHSGSWKVFYDSLLRPIATALSEAKTAQCRYWLCRLVWHAGHPEECVHIIQRMRNEIDEWATEPIEVLIHWYARSVTETIAKSPELHQSELAASIVLVASYGARDLEENRTFVEGQLSKIAGWRNVCVSLAFTSHWRFAIENLKNTPEALEDLRVRFATANGYEDRENVVLRLLLAHVRKQA